MRESGSREIALARRRAFMNGWRSRANLRRAARTSMVAGPLLVLINQTSLIRSALDGEMPSPLAALRIGMTFLVPFLVSLCSSAMADAAQSGGA